MKRYIRTNAVTDFGKPHELSDSEIIKIAKDVLAEHEFSANLHVSTDKELTGMISEYKHQSVAVDEHDNIVVDGYSGTYAKIQVPSEWTNTRDRLIDYLQDLMSDKDRDMNNLFLGISRITQMQPYVTEAEIEVADHFKANYPEVKTKLELVLPLEISAYYFKEACPRYNFYAWLAPGTGEYQGRYYFSYHEVKSGEAAATFIEKIEHELSNEQLRNQHRSDQHINSRSEYLNVLRSFDIDTTKSDYELFAESYDNRKPYKKKFKCNGDYLAYFSMAVHGSPTKAKLDQYFGIDEFAEIVEAYPTLEDISAVAEQSWFGDGDDYIYYLKNLTTGETLYASEEGKNL